MIEQRLEELRHELSKGEQQLRDLERERAVTRDTILRIQGAIQVLEELLAAQAQPASQPDVRPVLARTTA